MWLSAIKNKLQNKNTEQLSPKVQLALIEHVFKQATLIILSSLFCASIVFIGLFYERTPYLAAWYILFVLITVIRLTLIHTFNKRKVPQQMRTIRRWKLIYIVGAILAGASWGLSAFLLFPYTSPMGGILIILMMAGVTGGVVPISSAIPAASIGFLIFGIMPYIFVLPFMHNQTYILFDITLVLYLSFSVSVTWRNYTLIKNLVQLRFENEYLLQDFIGAKKELETITKKLKHITTHDTLTNTANRSLFQSNLETTIKNAEKMQCTIALLYINLDHFKLINYANGYIAGDKLLIKIFEKLHHELEKEKNFIARLGGDEIAIALEAPNVETVQQIAARICKTIGEPVMVDRVNLQLTASIGISLYPTDGHNAEQLLKHADRTMMYVKKHGGNQFYFYQQMKHAEIKV